MDRRVMEQLISVIVLAYNAEKDIEKCLRSILNQTYKNLEVIIINDGSTDSTSHIIKNIADERVRLIERENKGTYYSRVEGYKISNGNYIAFVDSDDYIEETYIETLYNSLISYNADIAHCLNKELKNGKVISNPKSDRRIYTLTNDEFYRELYNTIEFNPVWKQLYKKELLSDIESIDKPLIYGEDLLCNTLIYKKMKSIVIVNDDLYVYKINKSGITLSNSLDKTLRKINDIIYVYKRIFDEEINAGYKRRITSKMYYYLSINLYIMAHNLKRKEFTTLVKNYLIQINDMPDYIDNYYKNNHIINHACKLLINKKINRLYYFDK